MRAPRTWSNLSIPCVRPATNSSPPPPRTSASRAVSCSLLSWLGSTSYRTATWYSSQSLSVRGSRSIGVSPGCT